MKKQHRRKPTHPIVRNYKKGKLFGKHSGKFVFNEKPKEDKKRQLKLDL